MITIGTTVECDGMVGVVVDIFEFFTTTFYLCRFGCDELILKNDDFDVTKYFPGQQENEDGVGIGQSESEQGYEI